MNTNSILDLGTLSGPVLAFGGPYGNLEATRALLEIAGNRGISGHNLICTGDLVAYCADPQAVCDLVRQSGAAIAMGNCEESLGLDAADCGCGFEDGTTCAALSEQWFTRARQDVNGETKRWMAALPRFLRFRLGGVSFGVVHGCADVINRFVWPSTDATTKRADFAALGVDAIIAGHSGIPFAEHIASSGGDKHWINAGAIGMPANDGTPRVWYCLIEPEADGIAVSFHALTYDHAETAATMARRGYPAAYARALGTGLWPSLDVLPPAERALTGQPLIPAPLVIRQKRAAA